MVYESARDVFRGNPPSASHQPVPAKIQTLLERFEFQQFQSSADLVADAANSYLSGAGKVVVDVGQVFIAGGDRYTVAEAAATDHHLTTAGGVKLYVQPTSRGGVPAAAFGVGPSETAANNRTALQVAVNAALAAGQRRVILPDGVIECAGTIQLYDPTGADRSLRGKITLEGQGDVDISWARSGTTGVTGTVLKFTQTDATHGIEMSVASAGFDRRAITVKNLHVEYAGTGFGIFSDGCPEAQIEGAAVRVTSNAGSGIYMRDGWVSGMNTIKVIFAGAGVSTGTGITFGASLFAGQFTARDGVVDGFGVDVHVEDGSNFTNFNLVNFALQSALTYGLLIEGPLWNVNLSRIYAEFNGVGDIKVNPTTGTVSGFNIDGYFNLGGSTTASTTSGPLIDLTNAKQYSISNVKMYRPWSPLLHKGAGVGAGRMSNIDIKHDFVANLPTGPLYMLTADASTEFYLDSVTITADAKLALFDDTLHRVTSVDSDGVIVHALSHGALNHQTMAAGTGYDLHNASPRALSSLVTITGGGTPNSFKLPEASTDTDMRYVVNDPASTASLVLKHNARAAAIETLLPGEGATCIADKVNGKWLIMKTTAVWAT